MGKWHNWGWCYQSHLFLPDSALLAYLQKDLLTALYILVVLPSMLRGQIWEISWAQGWGWIGRGGRGYDVPTYLKLDISRRASHCKKVRNVLIAQRKQNITEAMWVGRGWWQGWIIARTEQLSEDMSGGCWRGGTGSSPRWAAWGPWWGSPPHSSPWWGRGQGHTADKTWEWVN